MTHMSGGAASDKLLAQFRADVSAALEEVAWPVDARDEALGALAEHAADPLAMREAMELAVPLVRTLSATADPPMALRNLDRYVRASFGKAGLFKRLLESERHRDLLARLFASSQFFSDIVARNPEYLDWCFSEAIIEDCKPLERYRLHLRQFLGAARTQESRRRALCRFKRRELLRIGVREMAGHGSIREYCRELSRLAQAACELAHDDVLADLSARHGLPARADGSEPRSVFCIVAMGKFGADELNFSSDIDLVFVYDEEGETTGRADSTGYVSGRVSSNEFYSRLSQGICAYLGDPTSEGVLYRVDARLRPEGKAGAMARSLPAYAAYFAEQARSWEKIAYQKARAVAGDEHLGEQFHAIARSFVFSGNRHDVLLPEMARLKRRIDEQAMDPDGANLDIKRGPGGIREIEFIVSALQLLHGGEDTSLRVRGTLDGLEKLVVAGKIDRVVAARLQDEYWFLRRVEHALQMLDEQQTHSLPAQRSQWRPLAVRCGYPDDEEFARHLDATRTWVRAQFEALFLGEESARPPALVERLETGGMADEESLRTLAPYGLGTPEGFTALRELLVGTREVAISSRGQRSFEALLPRLLDELRATVDPAAAVLGLSQFLRAHHAMTGIYQLLLEHPPILRLLVRTLGFSPLTSRLLVGHPGRFDQMLEGTALSAERSPRGEFERRYRPRMGALDGDARLEEIRRFKDRESLFVSARELLGICTLDEAAGQSTELAETSLQEFAREFARRHGIGDDWCILAFGSFGSRQVHVCADLDLAFFCDPGEQGAEMATPPELQSFASDLLAAMTAVTPQGRLWKTDARLRPDGANAPLVVTLERARRYYGHEAGVWEFQSATRARFACGSEEIAQRAIGSIAQAWRARTATVDLRAEIRGMRRRMAESTKLPRNVEIDLKRSPGGIVDIEFLAQYAALSDREFSFDVPETDKVLESPRFEELAGAEDADFLRSHHRALRRIQRLLRLMLESSRDYLPTQKDRRSQLERALAVAFEDPARTLDELPGRMRRARGMFDRILG